MMSKSPSEAQLLQWIDEFSFAVNDLVLFLNSHPNNQQAMACLRENLKNRNEALAEYARRFAPLTIDTANDAQSSRWQWISAPWPWEKKGGRC
ncbi:MAG: spore coat protein CotJB [Ruminococcus sp.]|jgi:spore coat protein JB